MQRVVKKLFRPDSCFYTNLNFFSRKIDDMILPLKYIHKVYEYYCFKLYARNM